MVLCIVASYNAYPVEDATTVACTPLYAVEDATAVNFNVAYQMLKSLINYSLSRNSVKVFDHNNRG